MDSHIEIEGTIVQGHGVASGVSKSSPYPKGSIEMQSPSFKERGLDLSAFHPGTLNISISPTVFEIIKEDFVFRHVAWASGFPKEDFSFIHCELKFNAVWHKGYVYYPHPETKTRHFQSKSTIEVITGFIENIQCGSTVTLKVNRNKVRLI
jgi:hypothetical protein